MRAALLPLCLAALAAAPAFAAPGSGSVLGCTPRLTTACGADYYGVARDSIDCPSDARLVVWDWTTGYASIEQAGAVFGCDTLLVTGLNMGEPLDLRFRARVIYEVGATNVPASGFDYEVWFGTRGEGLFCSAIVNPGEAPRSGDQVVECVIHRTAGVPFPMRWTVNAGAPSGYTLRLRAQWEVLDLPTGANLVSVAGYRADGVPVLNSSWGRLKAAYR